MLPVLDLASSNAQAPTLVVPCKNSKSRLLVEEY